MSLYNDIVAIARKSPEKIVLSYDDEQISYSQLQTSVDELSQGFSKIGFKRGMHIGLLLHNSLELVVALYAISQLNCIAVLLNSELSIDEIIYESKRLNLKALIIENYTYNKFLSIRCPSEIYLVLRNRVAAYIPYLDQLKTQGRQELLTKTAPFQPKQPILDTEMFIQSSSGTTGNRKTAYRTFGNINSDLNSIIKTLQYKSDDIIYCPVPLHHGYGLTMGLLAPIRAGCQIIIDRWFMTNRAAKIFNVLHPTIFLSVPELFNIMINSPEVFNLKSLRYCICSGEPLDKNTALLFHKKQGIWINQIYGMMETSSITANLEPNIDNIMSVGKPFKNVSVQLKKTNKESEILIKSQAISPTYINTRNKSKIRLKDCWFSSGDIGYFDNNGNLYITGRKNKTTII